MGKRSGVPHTDAELEKLTGEELQAEIDRSRLRLGIPPSAKVAKQLRQRIHWLEAAIARRTCPKTPTSGHLSERCSFLKADARSIDTGCVVDHMSPRSTCWDGWVLVICLVDWMELASQSARRFRFSRAACRCAHL